MSDSVSGVSQTSRLCPFQTITVTGSNATGVKCIKNSCQLWVPNNTSGKSEDEFTVVVGCNNRDGVVTPGSPAEDDDGRCGMQTSDFMENVFRLSHHLHRHHEHPKVHAFCTQLPSGCGDIFFGNSIPKSMKLLMEFDTFEDQDANGKIFGKDFTILPDDSTPPSMLNLTSPPNVPVPIPRVRWSDIIDDKFPPYVKFIKPSKVSKDGGIWIKVFGAFFAGNLNSFEIKIGKPSDGIPYVTVTDFVIIDFNNLYFRMPSFNTLTEERLLDLYLKNAGNTFDLPLSSLILNSGGESVYNNIIKIKMEVDDIELKNTMRNEVLNATEDMELDFEV